MAKIRKLKLRKKTEIQQHLSKFVAHAFDGEMGKDVTGYAMVVFKKNGASQATWHTSKAGIYNCDLPAMVNIRLVQQMSLQGIRLI